jgi:hypothetical protein
VAPLVDVVPVLKRGARVQLRVVGQQLDLARLQKVVEAELV